MKKPVKDGLIYRQKLTAIRAQDAPVPEKVIKRSKDSADVFRQIWDIDTIGVFESGYALFLNRANKTIGYARLSEGGVSGTAFDPKIIFAHALLAGASGLIIAHNHPSGSLIASQADKIITQRLKTIGKDLDMPLLDHIILSGTDETYLSFADDCLV
nr:JAB domain-containing protein [uncultured Arsenicibacter sp.]